MFQDTATCGKLWGSCQSTSTIHRPIWPDIKPPTKHYRTGPPPPSRHSILHPGYIGGSGWGWSVSPKWWGLWEALLSLSSSQLPPSNTHPSHHTTSCLQSPSSCTSPSSWHHTNTRARWPQQTTCELWSDLSGPSSSSSWASAVCPSPTYHNQQARGLNSKVSCSQH